MTKYFWYIFGGAFLILLLIILLRCTYTYIHQNWRILLFAVMVASIYEACRFYDQDNKEWALYSVLVAILCLLLLLFIPIFVRWHYKIRQQRLAKKQEELNKAFQKELLSMHNNITEIDYLEGHDFEEWCAALLRENGFTDVTVTPGSGDQGVDIIACCEGEKYAIQCKRYNQPLGNKPIQEVYSGKVFYNCDRAVVMTNNYFTPGAKAIAEKTGVILWDRKELKKMISRIKG